MGKKKHSLFIETLLIAGIAIFGFANLVQAQDTNPLRPTLPPDGLALEALRQAQQPPPPSLEPTPSLPDDESEPRCNINYWKLAGVDKAGKLLTPSFPKCPKINDCNAYRDAFEKYININENNILNQLQTRINTTRNLQCEADLGGYGVDACQRYAETMDELQKQMLAWNCAITRLRTLALNEFQHCQALAAKAACDVINPLDSIKIIPSKDIRDGDFSVDEDEEISRVEDGGLFIEE